MEAVQYQAGCEPEGLTIGQVPVPMPKDGEVLIKVYATAINRADTLQRKGLYPAPAGESEILGLEAAGVIDCVPNNTKCQWKKGDRVMALAPGGGNAQFVAIRAEHLISIPPNMSFAEAAAIPEVWLTAFQLLNRIAHLKQAETVLVHACASGVGTAAIQLVKCLYNGKIVGTVGSDTKKDFITKWGADKAINYKTEDFVQKTTEYTESKGVNVVLDCVGSNYWQKNLDCLAIEGRWVLYGLLSGGEINGNFLSQFLRKRIRMEGTTLRARTNHYKAELVADFTRDVMPLFSSGLVKPVIDRVLPFSSIGQAHRFMESNKSMGKIILTVCED